MQMLLISILFAVTTLLGTIWMRVQAHRRWQAAVDTYAERELAQATRNHSPADDTQPTHRSTRRAPTQRVRS